MAGYFGTETQRRLQARAEADDGFVGATAGACQAGRFMGCDDPDLFGWERIAGLVARDGLVGFRLIPAARIDEIRSRLKALSCRLDTWDVFLADRDSALALSERIVDRGLPEGLTELEPPVDPEGRDMARLQELMASTGVVPFSGSFLAGAFGPVATVVVGDASGAVVAAAHGYKPHNAQSPYRGYAWGGLVAVSESRRGCGLGAYVNARMVVRVFRELGASHVYELISPTNVPSRRMVEACGLRLDPGLFCGIGSPEATERFTR